MASLSCLSSRSIVCSLMCLVGVSLVLCINILTDLTVLWVQNGIVPRGPGSPGSSMFEIRVGRIFQAIWVIAYLHIHLTASWSWVPTTRPCRSCSLRSRLSNIVELLRSLFNSATKTILVICLASISVTGWVALFAIGAIIPDYRTTELIHFVDCALELAGILIWAVFIGLAHPWLASSRSSDRALVFSLPWSSGSDGWPWSLHVLSWHRVAIGEVLSSLHLSLRRSVTFWLPWRSRLPKCILGCSFR